MRAPQRRLDEPDAATMFRGALERDARISERRRPTWVERSASDDPARSEFIDKIRARKRLVSGNDEAPTRSATLADGPRKYVNYLMIVSGPHILVEYTTGPETSE